MGGRRVLWGRLLEQVTSVTQRDTGGCRTHAPTSKAAGTVSALLGSCLHAHSHIRAGHFKQKHIKFFSNHSVLWLLFFSTSCHVFGLVLFHVFPKKWLCPNILCLMQNSATGYTPVIKQKNLWILLAGDIYMPSLLVDPCGVRWMYIHSKAELTHDHDQCFHFIFST